MHEACSRVFRVLYLSFRPCRHQSVARQIHQKRKRVGAYMSISQWPLNLTLSPSFQNMVPICLLKIALLRGVTLCVYIRRSRVRSSNIVDTTKRSFGFRLASSYCIAWRVNLGIALLDFLAIYSIFNIMNYVVSQISPSSCTLNALHDCVPWAI